MDAYGISTHRLKCLICVSGKLAIIVETRWPIIRDLYCHQQLIRAPMNGRLITHMISFGLLRFKKLPK